MLDYLVQFLRSVLSLVTGFLPSSPFEQFYSSFTVLGKGLGWLNWFIPVGTLLTIMSAWLIAIAAYYVIKALLHWVGLND